MKKKNTLMLFIGLFAFIMVVGGVSYGYFVYNKDVAAVDLSSGEISINYSTNNSNLTLSNVIGMSDEQGKISTNYLDFTVTGKADIEPILYELEIVSSNSDLNDYIRVYLTDTNDNPILSPFGYNELYDAMKNDGKTIYQNLVEGNIDGSTKTTTENFRLRVWLDESYRGVSAQSFSVSTYLYALNVDTTNLRRVTFSMQDGRNNGPVKYVTLGEDYGSLPTPSRKGYRFLGWNGKNLLDYNNLTSFAEYYGIGVDVNGYVSDSSSTTDSRAWEYSASNWFVDLNYGKYTISLFFKNQCTSTYCRVALYSPQSIVLSPGLDINNLELFSKMFQVNEANNYGVLIKGYDSIYRVQLESGETSTEWEPYYVTSDVEVTERNDEYVLKAIWDGSIESCPNCKFIYTTNELWTTWNNQSQTPTELTSGYSTNYNDIVQQSGKNYFLGVVTNGSNQITKAYACGLKDGTTPFCIEGTSDGSNYSSNSSYINGASLWNNTCTVGANSTQCGPWDNSSVSASALSFGYVDAGVSSDYRCRVYPDGIAYCYDSSVVGGQA